MRTIKVALLGFGTVGQGVYETIQTHQKRFQQLLGAKVEVVAILIKDIQKERHVNPNIILTTDYEDIINIEGLDVVFEAIVGDEPGRSYIERAIEKGIHIVTANKQMFSKHASTLLRKAEERNIQIGFEATTAGGTPIIRTIQHLLQVNQITRIQGIVNGTSNFILTEMNENNLPFEHALELAQENGYAEADPSNDIDGSDAFYKCMILCQQAFGFQPDWSEVEKIGIESIDKVHISLAENAGYRFKHIIDIRKDPQGIYASVQPLLVDDQHPLYHINGVDNALTIEADIVGSITLRGPGAGKLPTASAMIEDFIHIWQTQKQVVKEKQFFEKNLVSRGLQPKGEEHYNEWGVFSQSEIPKKYFNSKCRILEEGTKYGHYFYSLSCTQELIEVIKALPNISIYPVHINEEKKADLQNNIETLYA